MPTYDYRCEKCGHFEYVQPITAEALTNCPHCGSSVKRLISHNINIVFKGSGFHITDYRSESYKNKAKAEATSINMNGSSKPSPSTKEA
jgi:putative FmdB family regulatory protein